MRLEDFIKRADDLIGKADQLLKTEYTSNYTKWVDGEKYCSLRSAALSFLAAAFGKDHSYYTEFNSTVTAAYSSLAEAGRGILTAARDEMAGGWIHTTKGLVSAEVFADFLEMAEHLLEQDYKDPAAVLVGSVLEEHLRQLCQKHSIPIEVKSARGDMVPKKADVLNADLAKAGVYNLLNQKSVTARLNLRNKAAHGKYTEYDKPQVSLKGCGAQKRAQCHSTDFNAPSAQWNLPAFPAAFCDSLSDACRESLDGKRWMSWSRRGK